MRDRLKQASAAAPAGAMLAGADGRRIGHEDAADIVADVAAAGSEAS